MISFDPSFRFGDLGGLIGTAFAAGILYQRVRAIERKLDTFITKDTVAALNEGADHEHAAIRREINGLRQEIHDEA